MSTPKSPLSVVVDSPITIATTPLHAVKLNGSSKAQTRHRHGTPIAFSELIVAAEKDIPEEVDLSSQKLEDAGAFEVASILKRTDKIHGLCLRETGIGVKGGLLIAEALLGSDSLEGLDLSRNPLGLAVSKIAQSLQVNTHLLSLQLDETKMTDVGYQNIADALINNNTLQTLSMFKNELGQYPQSTNALSKALMVNRGLTSLNLMFNSIGVSGLKILHSALLSGMNHGLTHLNLAYNKFGEEGAKTIAKIIKSNTTLRKLELWRNKFGDNGAEVIAFGLQYNKTLFLLDLRYNDIKAKGSVALAKALEPEKSTLAYLDLWNNSIAPRGAHAFAQILKTNTTLTALNLRGTFIGFDGATHLAEGLKTSANLCDLSLWRTKLGPEGVVPICLALEVNISLTSLNLNANDIGKRTGLLRQAPGIKALAKALKANKNLVSLWLDSNCIDADGANDLYFQGIKENKSLTLVSLDKNEMKSPILESIKQHCLKNFTNFAPAVKGVLPLHSDIAEVILEYAGLTINSRQKKKHATILSTGGEDEDEEHEWEFRKAGGISPEPTIEPGIIPLDAVDPMETSDSARPKSLSTSGGGLSSPTTPKSAGPPTTPRSSRGIPKMGAIPEDKPITVSVEVVEPQNSSRGVSPTSASEVTIETRLTGSSRGTSPIQPISPDVEDWDTVVPFHVDKKVGDRLSVGGRDDHWSTGVPVSPRGRKGTGSSGIDSPSTGGSTSTSPRRTTETGTDSPIATTPLTPSSGSTAPSPTTG